MYANDYPCLEQTQAVQDASAQDDGAGLTAKITSYLRWVGSLLIVASAVGFMLQGHDEILPAYRYWICLGLTLMLCGGGLVCAYLFHETKGARIFFGLGAAFLPVQVSQVSAMIYAYWHGQAALQPQYRWLQFMDVSPAVIALDFVITGAMLLLVSYAGFAVLARKHLKTLLIAAMAGNALLLLPLRDPDIIPFIIAGLFVYLRSTEQFLHRDGSMRLAEGFAARALIALPLWIMIGRSLLHPMSYSMAIVLSSVVVTYGIFDIKRYTRSAWIVYIGQWLGTFAAVWIWLLLMDRIGVEFGSQPAALLPIAVILFALSGKVAYHARLYRIVSTLLAVLLSFGSFAEEQALAPVYVIAAGILLTVAGIRYREKLPFFGGNLCVFMGFLFYWDYAVDLYATAPWISSIVLGLLVILLASYIENKQKQIVAKSRHYLNVLKEWQ